MTGEAVVLVLRNGKPIFGHRGTEDELTTCINAAKKKHIESLEPYQRCNYDDVFNWKTQPIKIYTGIPKKENKDGKEE